MVHDVEPLIEDRARLRLQDIEGMSEDKRKYREARSEEPALFGRLIAAMIELIHAIGIFLEGVGDTAKDAFETSDIAKDDGDHSA